MDNKLKYFTRKEFGPQDETTLNGKYRPDEISFKDIANAGYASDEHSEYRSYAYVHELHFEKVGPDTWYAVDRYGIIINPNFSNAMLWDLMNSSPYPAAEGFDLIFFKNNYI